MPRDRHTSNTEPVRSTTTLAAATIAGSGSTATRLAAADVPPDIASVMCGRYVLTMQAEEMARLFELDEVPDPRLLPERYNIAPTQPIAIIRMEEGRRRLAPVRWSLVPAWVKDPAEFPQLINARMEGMAEKPSFRNAFRRRRCLVPASGFYEWQGKGRGTKRPFFISLAGRAPFALAGLWETYVGGDGSELDGAAIVTKPASDNLLPFHDRMPVVLGGPEAIGRWLDPATSEREALAILEDARDPGFVPVEVSTRVNAVANDDAGLIAPVGDEPEPPAPAAKAKARTRQGAASVDQGRLF